MPKYGLTWFRVLVQSMHLKRHNFRRQESFQRILNIPRKELNFYVQTCLQVHRWQNTLLKPILQCIIRSTVSHLSFSCCLLHASNCMQCQLVSIKQHSHSKSMDANVFNHIILSVGECFFWYRLTRVVPDKFHRAVKRLCVCVCILSAKLNLNKALFSLKL